MVAALGYNIRIITLSVPLAGSARRNSASFAGVIGGPIQQVTPGVGDDVLLLALIVVVVGGLGSIAGSLRCVVDHRPGAVARCRARAAARLSAGGAVPPLRNDGDHPDRAAAGTVRQVTRAGLTSRIVVLALLVTAPAILDNYRTYLLTQILIFGLFAASLDVLLGYTALASLGHAGYFGVGGYAAGLLAEHVTPNAFAQLGVALAAAAGVALLTGLFAVRSRGIYFLMLTLAFGELLWVLALNWTSLTGGSNGIYGLPVATIAGNSTWLATTNHFYWYVLGAFVVGYVVLKTVVGSPFGRALGGIRGNEERMSSLGYDVTVTKLAVFTFAGAVAGYAGALACQQAKYFSPDEMSFGVSAVAVVVIVIGGQRTLIGAVLGAAFYYVIRDQLSGVLSSHWQLALGIVFVLVVYLLPGGLVAGGQRLRRAVGR